jgi:formamidopyrimidine-DNA glycosylase
LPELPDVEGFRRVCRRAKDRRIEGVDVLDQVMLRNSSPRAVDRGLRGLGFREPVRHGKWLYAPTGDGPTVLMHFGMTGLLEWAPSGERHLHDRLVVRCEGGELRYRNMRKFGGVWLARDEREREAITGRLGPDAAALGRDDFHDLLGRRRGGAKAALMDQRLIAGLGNLMVDETLWRAKVHPRADVARMSARRLDAIYESMEGVVRESIPTGRVPGFEGWITGVRDRPVPECPRCGTRMRKATVAGRTTCWCPRCQRR